MPVREPVSKREIALGFLNQVMIGRITEAFEKYIAREGFRHHNPYFRGDRESLEAAMMEANRNFPNSTLEVKHVFEDENVVAVHSRVQHSADTPEIAVVHIFRIDRQKISQLWDVGVQMPKDSPNENGLF